MPKYRPEMIMSIFSLGFRFCKRHSERTKRPDLLCRHPSTQRSSPRLWLQLWLQLWAWTENRNICNWQRSCQRYNWAAAPVCSALVATPFWPNIACTPNGSMLTAQHPNIYPWERTCWAKFIAKIKPHHLKTCVNMCQPLLPSDAYVPKTAEHQTSGFSL